LIPIKLTLENFQSHTKSVLDFDFTSVLIVGELDGNSDISNGSGKSALFESMAWALFGKSRQTNADGVVKRGADYCQVDFVFEHDSIRYKVSRKRNVRYSRSEVLFWRFLPDGTEEAISGDTNSEINDHIKNLIKSNYEVFVNSNYFMQKSISDFMSGTTSERQKIIASIMFLERWNKYMKAAATKAAEHEKLVGQIQFKLNGLSSVEENLANSIEMLKNSKVEAEDLHGLYERLAQEILDLEKKTTDLKANELSLNEYHDNVSRLDNVRSRIRDLENSLAEKNIEKTKLLERIDANSIAIEQMTGKIQEISGHLDLKNHIDLSSIEKELVDCKTKRSWFLKQVNGWNGSDTCKCCGKPWSSHPEKLSEHEANIREVKQLDGRLLKVEEKFSAAKTAVEKLKQTEIEVEKYTSRKKSLESSNEINALKRDVLIREVSGAQENLDLEKQKERDLLGRIKGIEEIAASDTFDKVRSLLKEKKLEREAIVKRRNELSYTVGGLTQKVEELRRNVDEKLLLQEELRVNTISQTVYDTLVRSFGRNGIQSVIIDNVIEELTRSANEWLNDFCHEPTYIRFVTQRKDSKGGWKETLDIDVITPSGSCDFESLSGGEAFRIAFAIRLALSQIQARRMGGEMQVLLLDEVSSALDKHGLDMFVSIIKKLERTIKIMVVTHDDNLKDSFNHVIKIKKVGNSSSIAED